MSIDAQALELVEAALAIEPGTAREAFITDAAGADAALIARVRQLLAFDTAAVPATDALVRSIAPDLPVPERLGPWRLGEAIGEGGMGTVHRAWRDDGRFDQSVAIKLIRHAAGAARFAEERRMLGRLDHPGIVRIIDGGEAEGLAWLAMELVEGETLDRACAQLAPPAILALFAEVCAGVAHAHRQLIVHADIKPSNVMVDTRGQARLLDFGIARLIASDNAAEGPYPLTRQFAAPERLAGAMPTIAGDVFSLGELLRAILPAPVSADCAAIIARATAPDPAERYPDVARLGDDVARTLGGHPVEARQGEGARYRLACFVRRNRARLGWAAAVAMVLLAAGGISLNQSWRAAAAEREAAARFGDARGTSRYLLDTLLPRLESQPGALALRAEVAGFAQRALDHLAAARADQGEVRLEAATGLWRLAAIEAGSNGPNLGQTGPAEANLRRAEAIAAALPGPQARQLLARVLIDRVRLATTMRADLPVAEALSQRMEQALRAAGPLDPGLAVRADAVLSDLKCWQGDFAGERRFAQSALDRHPADPLMRASLEERLAEADYYEDHPALALTHYRQALGAIEAALARQPGSMYARSRRMQENWNIGTTLMQLGEPRQALPILAAGTDEARAVLAFDPADNEARRNLRVIAAAQAQALALNGRRSEAMAMLTAQLDADEARARADTGNARLDRDVLYDRMVIGETLDGGHDRPATCAWDRATRDRIAAFARRGHLSGLDAANNVKLVNARITRNCGGD